MDLEQPSHIEQTALTDSQLWQAAEQGQANALGILYDRHAGLVYGIALKVLSNVQEAEDLTQNIFIKLLHSSYDPQRGSLRTFLAILTRSRAIDRVRSRQREAEKFQQYLRNDATASVPATLEDTLQERSKEIYSALVQLSDDQQQLLKMTYYDGLTQANIAKQLDLPLGTVKSKVRRGLLRLREILQNQLN